MDEVEQREWKCIKILKDCIDDEKEIPYAVVQLYKNNFKR